MALPQDETTTEQPSIDYEALGLEPVTFGSAVSQPVTPQSEIDYEGLGLEPVQYGISIPKKEPEGPSDWDTLRGLEVSMRQVPQLAYGVAGLVGATSEQITGYGEALRDWGFRGYKDWESSIEPISKETDDVTVAWQRAKEGDVGALVDWAQYGIGYALGQLGETAAIATLGALTGGAAGLAGGPTAVPAAAGGAVVAAAGKTGFKALAKNLVDKAIANQAKNIVTQQAKKEGIELTAEQIAKRASQDAIKRQAGKEIGSDVAVFSNAIGMQLGSIYGEAESKAQAEGRELTGNDLARVWATGLATGGVEGIVDKFGLDLLKGKLSTALPEGRLAGAAVAGGVGLVGEAGTEAIQTVGERFGSGKDILSDEAINEYINAAALGGIAGGGIGGVGGFVSGNPRENAAAKAKVSAEATKTIAPETANEVAKQADAVINQVAQETPDQRVARLQQEAKAAASITLEEEGGAGFPPDRIKSARWFESASRNRLKELQDKWDAGREDFTTQEKDEFDFLKTNPTPEQVAERYGYGVAPAVEPTAVTTTTQPTTPAVAERTPVEPKPTLTPPSTVTEPTAPTTLQPDLLSPEGKTGEERSTIDQENRRKTEEFINRLEDGEYQVFDSSGEKNGIAKVKTNKSGRKVVEYVTDDGKQFIGDAKSLVPELNFARFTDATGKEGFDRGSLQKIAPVAPTPEAAPAAVEPPPFTPPPVTPQLEPLRRVARAEQTEEDVAGLVDAGFAEVYKGQPVLTQAGLEALPEAERPRLTPEARKIQIDTRTSEAAAEAISKNLRIGVDQVPADVRMPAGWTLEGDVYVPPQPQAVAPAPTPEVREARREPAITPQQDRDYLDAVERGDLDVAQRMVDDAARVAGYNVLPLFHGTEADIIKKFRKKLSGIWLAFKRGAASPSSGERPTTIINAYADLGDNPITLTDEQAKEWQRSGSPLKWMRDFRLENRATSVIIGDYATVVFKPSQVKSADPVTYDDQGNIIPLSQRFQPEQADIRYRRRVQMGRIGMEQAAVESRLQELGFPTGGIIRVVNQPDADFEGRTIILDGKVTGIELNASALRDNAAIDRVLNHEFAESANADGALNKLVERLTPKEKKEINDTITRLRYEERARTTEEAARAIEALAEAWNGRGFFTRAVARIEAWASKLGFKLTRRAAEYIAARNLADINSGFRTAYNQTINRVSGDEARYSYAGQTAKMSQFMLDSLSVAKSMAANGENPETIRNVTGWIVNPYDKKLRWEIPDTEAKLKPNFGNAKKVSDLIDHKALFAAYPDIADVTVEFRGYEAGITQDAKTVVLPAMSAGFSINNQSLLSGILHEVQHLIQAREGFARGGNLNSAYNSEKNRIARNIEKLEAIRDEARKTWESKRTQDNATAYKNAVNAVWEAMNEKPARLSAEQQIEYYNRIAGEIESRDVEARRVFTPEQRRAAAPYSSENISPEDAIIIGLKSDAGVEIRESRRDPEAIPTFTEGTPEAATLKEMEVSMAKVDAASEAKGGKPETYKISEIASVWMDSGLDERALQDAIVEYTNLTPANAARVAKAIARQYDIQQSIAAAMLETPAGLSVEALPEGVTLPKEVDPDRPKPVMQRLFEVFMGVKVPPKKITGSEKAFLRSQILLKIAANRAAKNAQKATADAVVETIKSMGLYGEVRPKQVAALAKRAAKVIWTSEKSVEVFNDYAARVVANANYDADLREAKAAQKRAKQLSKQKEVAMSPQRQILDYISRVAVNRLDDPRMFADVVNYYMRAFKKATSPDYVVMPDSEMTSYLSQMEGEATTNQAEIDRIANERLAAKYGVSVDDVGKLVEADNIVAELQRAEDREAMENLLTEKAIETQLGLSGYDTSSLSSDQKPLVEALLKVDPSRLDSKEKQKFIRIANNVIYNDQTNGAQMFVAIANGQQNAREAAQDSSMIKKNRAWIDILPTLGSKSAEKTFRNWALELQSVADTFRNIFGKESMGKMFRLMGLYDLDRGFTDSNNVLDKIQEAMAEFYKKNVKKYKAAARNQDGILSEGIVGFLIQRVPAKGEAESIAQRRDLIKQDIANRRSSQESDRIAMADRIEKILNEIDGNSAEEILNNLKQKYRPNYDSVIYLMNDLLPQYKEFLQKFDENFNDQANNYDNPYYLPIDFISSGPALEITPESEAQFYDNVSLRPKQAANTIKRVDYTKLPTGKNNKPMEIQFNLRKGTYDSLSEQINSAYTSEAWQKIFSFMKTPEAETALGGAANRDFMVERLNRLRISRMRRGAMNNGAMAKLADSISVIGRKLGVGIALGGVYQVFKQSPDQLISAIGTTGRPDLLSESITTIGKAKAILDKFSIGRRGDASAGYKYINQMEGAQNRLERAFTESKWSEVKESASKVADVWMLALKKTDFACAAAAWMTYYRADLDKRGIKFEGWDREAQLVDTDPARQDAASYAENMTDIYQGSSDPTKMATFAQSGKSGWENLFKAIFVPFNSFAVQQRMRIYSDARDAFTQSGEAKLAGSAGLTATIGGMLMFHTVRRLWLPVLTGAGATALYALLGVDMDEPDEEKQKEEANKRWRQFQGEVIANMLVGGAPQFVEAQLIDAINYSNYLVSLQLESDDVIDDKGEIMSFDKYQKERSPLWRYRSFDNAMTLGMLDIGFGQAEKAVVQTKMLATPEEMEKYTPEEQRLLWFSALSEWMYLMRLNDADFARMVTKARKDMEAAVKDREKQIKAIREGR